ncbi:MAG: phosphotransferase [Planctomycetes bacterium]|nr:phosphotransferase [Planctomycetota bacterium]
MRIRGHSGCEVSFIDESTIRKSAKAQLSQRLKRQIEKQQDFSSAAPFERIRTPRVLRVNSTSDAYYADMEFISAKDFVQFLTEAGQDALDGFLETVSGFIHANLANSRVVEVGHLVDAKLIELERQNIPAQFIAAAREQCADGVVIPVGPCHGDLTLSNILFQTSRIYLLDFLDGFVESPILDIVKLRQDTCFGWSIELYDLEFDRTKVRIALRYLDRHIESAFATFDWYQRHYDLFQLINWMRILPYCRGRQTAGFVSRRLAQIVGDYHLTTVQAETDHSRDVPMTPQGEHS